MRQSTVRICSTRREDDSAEIEAGRRRSSQLQVVTVVMAPFANVIVTVALPPEQHEPPSSAVCPAGMQQEAASTPESGTYPQLASSGSPEHVVPREVTVRLPASSQTKSTPSRQKAGVPQGTVALTPFTEVGEQVHVVEGGLASRVGGAASEKPASACPESSSSDPHAAAREKAAPRQVEARSMTNVRVMSARLAQCSPSGHYLPAGSAGVTATERALDELDEEARWIRGRVTPRECSSAQGAQRRGCVGDVPGISRGLWRREGDSNPWRACTLI